MWDYSLPYLRKRTSLVHSAEEPIESHIYIRGNVYVHISKTKQEKALFMCVYKVCIVRFLYIVRASTSDPLRLKENTRKKKEWTQMPFFLDVLLSFPLWIGDLNMMMNFSCAVYL